jgi:diguanylate cyclase (GGDEF)-like protein/PAS domain S-box-containing protein
VGRQADPERTPSCRLIRNEAALILEVEGPIADILGWTAADLVGNPSTTFIHPEDQPSAVAAWFDMLVMPGSVRAWRGRYRTSDGSWRFVETVNENRLEDPDRPVVVTVLRGVSPEQAGVEAELRAREQLISRLADALPVGVFQLDDERRVTFTNDRFHTIIGRPPAATADAQFANLVPADLDRFTNVISEVLRGQPVDGLEIQLSTNEEPAQALRACEISMRPLTDHAGTVIGAIGCINDVTVAVRLRNELEHRATTDALTGCTNRAAILELVESSLDNLSADDHGVAVVFIDLDDFKGVNDRHGHAAGDALLVEAARRIRSAIRSGDHLGRIGGDEFLVLSPDVTDAEAGRVADRIRTAIHAPIAIAGADIELRAAVGLSWSSNETSADCLIAAADERMYQAKSHRRAAAVGT